MTCRNHPDVEATHTAKMPAAVKQPDGTYLEIPLCEPCARNVHRLAPAWPITPPLDAAPGVGEPGDEVHAHLIGRAATGHAVSKWTGDIIVTMDLWAHDLPGDPGHFAMLPDQARILAAALIDSADQADADPR